MSEIETPWGTLRRVQRDGAWIWKLRCPQCGHWGEIDDDQLHGRISLDHTNCGIAYAPSECDCTWHETHDYTSIQLVATALRVQARAVEDAALLDRIAAGPVPETPEKPRCAECDGTGTVYLDSDGDECAEPDSVREVACPHCAAVSGTPEKPE